MSEGLRLANGRVVGLPCFRHFFGLRPRSQINIPFTIAALSQRRARKVSILPESSWKIPFRSPAGASPSRRLRDLRGLWRSPISSARSDVSDPTRTVSLREERGIRTALFSFSPPPDATWLASGLRLLLYRASHLVAQHHCRHQVKHVPFCLRRLQDRDRAVEFSHDGPNVGCPSLS